MLEVLQRISSVKENEEPLLQRPQGSGAGGGSLPRSASRRSAVLQRTVERALAERLASIRRRSSDAGHDGSFGGGGGGGSFARAGSTRSGGSGADIGGGEWSDDDDAVLDALLGSDDEEEPRAPPSRLYLVLWWLGVVLAVVGPQFVAYWADVPDTLRAMGRHEAAVVEFSDLHRIDVPPPPDPSSPLPARPVNYSRVDASLTRWHADLQALHDRVLRLKVLDAVSQSNLEFAMGRAEEFEPRRDYTISVYFALSILVYFTENVHLALVLLQFNLYDLAVCFRVKSLDDAFAKVLDPLQDAIEAMFLLPLEASVTDVAQQSYVLTKMRAMQASWESASLGISFSVPFFRTVLSLNIGLLISIVAATTVRCLNVAVYGFYPSLPRVNLVAWLLGSGSAVQQQASMADGDKAAADDDKPGGAGGASDGAAASSLRSPQRKKGQQQQQQQKQGAYEHAHAGGSSGGGDGGVGGRPAVGAREALAAGASARSILTEASIPEGEHEGHEEAGDDETDAGGKVSAAWQRAAARAATKAAEGD